MTYYGSLRSLASLRFAPFRSFTSLAGVLYGGLQGFQVRKDIITTTLILAFFGKGERLMLDQKK